MRLAYVAPRLQWDGAMPPPEFQPVAGMFVSRAHVTVVAGPRGTGKTTRVLDLVRHARQGHSAAGAAALAVPSAHPARQLPVVVFTDLPHEYADVPECEVRASTDVQWLEHAVATRGPGTPPLVVVLEGGAGNYAFARSDAAARVFAGARHARLHLFVTLQNARDIRPHARAHVDLFVLTPAWNLLLMLRDVFPNVEPSLVHAELRSLRGFEALVSAVQSGQLFRYASRYTRPGHVAPDVVHAGSSAPAQIAPDMPP